MATGIDRQKVRESFHKQALEYDKHALVQKKVVERLFSLVEKQGISPGRVLDIGAGTGNLLGMLRRRFPRAELYGADLAFGMCRAAEANLREENVRLVNADAERLPFKEGSFDLVVSSSTYQWLATLDGAFDEVKRVLSPGGVFCFALFGERTLYELRDSYRKVLKGGADRSHGFLSQAEVLDALRRTGLSGCEVASELEVGHYPDVADLLRTLKRIGAGSTAPVSSKGLSERRVMLEMMDAYRADYGRDGAIPASYEVLYGTGRKIPL